MDAAFSSTSPWPDAITSCGSCQGLLCCCRGQGKQGHPGNPAAAGKVGWKLEESGRIEATAADGGCGWAEMWLLKPQPTLLVVDALKFRLFPNLCFIAVIPPLPAPHTENKTLRSGLQFHYQPKRQKRFPSSSHSALAVGNLQFSFIHWTQNLFLEWTELLEHYGFLHKATRGQSLEATGNTTKKRRTKGPQVVHWCHIW